MKKQKSNSGLYTIIVIAVIAIIIIVACNSPRKSFDSNVIGFSNANYTSIKSNYTIPDYSNTSYVQVMPGENKSQFILLECVNSTLKITNNQVICIK